MANVYAWPPVGHIRAGWSVVAPLGQSRSLIHGGEYVSAAQRRRRIATLEVSALAMGQNGAGYMEVLKRLLDGGLHLVRLYSTPINWRLSDNAEAVLRPRPMSWIVPPGAFGWDGPAGALEWWSGAPPLATAASEGGWPVLDVTGLPPARLVARPGEFVAMAGGTAMVRRPAHSDAEGAARIALLTPLAGSGALIIGAQETGVFKADSLPFADQPLSGNWSYSWNFTEVFADEGRGPFAEVNPWI